MAKQGEQRKQGTHIKDRAWQEGPGCPGYDHIFGVNRNSNSTQIPHKSLEHSSRLVRDLPTVLSEAADRTRLKNRFLFPPEACAQMSLLETTETVVDFK